MPKNSPPKHRHDGSSPLPLGMDWSPPPKRWEGRSTIWPHNPQTGWSYCVMIPSWIIQTEPGAYQESFLNPTVFYRIHVGIQSPDGISNSHGLLRRFNDFLKLYSALKKAFPRKDIPPAPPKHAFLRVNSSRMLLEEGRSRCGKKKRKKKFSMQVRFLYKFQLLVRMKKKENVGGCFGFQVQLLPLFGSSARL